MSDALQHLTGHLPCGRSGRRTPAPWRRAGRALVLAFLVGGCATGSGTTPDKADAMAPEEPAAYTLGPGDKLRITVLGHDQLSGPFEVDSAGRIAMPLIARVDAAGLTLAQLESDITKKLAERYIAEPRVSIDLVKSRPFCIFGEVNSPGCFEYVYGMTAAKAIAFAGGYTYRALQNELVITGEDGRTLAANQATRIRPGDTIEIKQRFF
jgi:polysaccharide export outer membrane protein